MRLRNQAFQAQTEAENRKKLEIVLRQLTGDQLTPEQRWQIAQAVGCRRQYRFRLCQGPDIPLNTADGHQMAAHLIFGDAKGESPGPAAVLVRCSTPGAESNTVYIYLPEEKEEQWDEIRKEETPAQ